MYLLSAGREREPIHHLDLVNRREIQYALSRAQNVLCGMGAETESKHRTSAHPERGGHRRKIRRSIWIGRRDQHDRGTPVENRRIDRCVGLVRLEWGVEFVHDVSVARAVTLALAEIGPSVPRRAEGWDTTFEALVVQIVVDYASSHVPSRAAAWIAELNGEPVGCIFCVASEEGTAKLRILLVDPSARGHGIGAQLVRECIEFAWTAGYRQITLWTNDVLTSARRIYQAAGFGLVDEESHHSFGHDLVGQNWILTLDHA